MIEIGPNLAEIIGCIAIIIGVVIIIWRWKR
jgi:drug/metabolite transporter (DMT)-like permease